MSSDPVNHPSHYTGWSNGAEIVDITENLNFNRGNAVKYIARAGRKDPEKELEDLRKAEFYLQREIGRMAPVSVLCDPFAIVDTDDVVESLDFSGRHAKTETLPLPTPDSGPVVIYMDGYFARLVWWTPARLEGIPSAGAPHVTVLNIPVASGG